jgi:DNA-directed RNA polymerase specialized sigma24 family protein
VAAVRWSNSCDQVRPRPHDQISTEDAEDTVQNAFISGHLHLRNFQGRSALKTWFTRVVLNAALMIRRNRKPVQLVSAPERATENGSNSQPNRFRQC